VAQAGSGAELMKFENLNYCRFSITFSIDFSIVKVSEVT
jgi:hypothetical protein